MFLVRKFTHIIFTALAVVATALASCDEGMFNNSEDGPLRLSADSIYVDLEAQSVSIGVTARDAAWTVSGAEEWFTVSPSSGGVGVTQVTVTFAANDPEAVTDARERTGTLAFSSGGEQKTIGVKQLATTITLPNEHPDKRINTAIFDLLKEWYYNGEPLDPSAAPDLNQSYDDFYFNYLSHLRRNEDVEGGVWARDNERYIYSYIERHPVGTAASALTPLNYGMEFELVDMNGRMAARVLYVEPGSPAATAGLQRGDWFNRVNRVMMDPGTTTTGDYRYYYNKVIDSLVRPPAGVSMELGMLFFNGSQQTLLDQGRTVTLSPARHRGNPILATQTFGIERMPEGSSDSVYVGYMMYNSFDPAYRSDVEEAFAEFKRGFEGQPLDNFIIDLRYNKSGSVEMAELVGSLLVGGVEGVAGQTFAEYEFAADNTGNTAAAGKTALFSKLENSLAADTVYVLTSPHTAGASELLINALRGLGPERVKLVVTGGVTQGLATGMVKRTYTDPTPDGMEYSAWILAFGCENADGEGGYNWGLVPNGGEVDEFARGDNLRWSTTWGWKSQLGATNDPILKQAVDMIAGRQFVPAGEVVNASKHARTGFPRKFCFPTNMTMEVAENSNNL